MTCIVGIVDAGRVVLGADSLGSAGYSAQLRDDEKVFRSGDGVIGFTTSFRLGQLLRYALPPIDCHHWDVRRWMAVEFMASVRATLKEHGALGQDANRDDAGTFLVGIRDQLFRVESDLQAGVCAAGFTAVGCGCEIALGAMHAMEALGDARPVRERITTALEASERFSCGVRRPWRFVETGGAP